MYRALLIYLLITVSSHGYSQENQPETTPSELNLKPKTKGSFIFTGGGTNHNTVIQTSNLKEMITTSPCMMWRHKIVKRRGILECI